MVRRSFCCKRYQNTVPSIYLISDFNGEEIVATFYKKKLEKNQTKFRIEKFIKKKADKLYAKWEGFDEFLLTVGLIKKNIV